MTDEQLAEADAKAESKPVDDATLWGVLRFDTFIVELRGDGVCLGRNDPSNPIVVERHGKVPIAYARAHVYTTGQTAAHADRHQAWRVAMHMSPHMSIHVSVHVPVHMSVRRYSSTCRSANKLGT